MRVLPVSVKVLWDTRGSPKVQHKFREWREDALALICFITINRAGLITYVHPIYKCKFIRFAYTRLNYVFIDLNGAEIKRLDSYLKHA